MVLKLEKEEMITRLLVVFMMAAFLMIPAAKSGRFGKTYAFERSSVIHFQKDATTTEQNNGDINGLNISMSDDGSSIQVTGLETSESTWTTIFKKYKQQILGVSGVFTLTFVIFFLRSFAAIGANADNPTGRSNAIKGALWTGIATALCGSVMIVMGLFWNALK